VTGVDPAAAMLTIARSKPYAELVEWVESPAQKYNSARPFDLIVMTGHAFQVLLGDDDVLAALNTMRHHLSERGKVVFESAIQHLPWAKEWAGRVRKLPGEVLERLEVTEDNGEFISFQTTYQWTGEKRTTRSTLRFSSQEHLRALITRSGLRVRQVLGDWDTSPLDATRSREMIFFVEHARSN